MEGRDPSASGLIDRVAWAIPAEQMRRYRSSSYARQGIPPLIALQGVHIAHRRVQGCTSPIEPARSGAGSRGVVRPAGACAEAPAP